VKVFEGERKSTTGNNLIGEFEISGIQRAKRGVPQIAVTFSVDANGILNVKAHDKTTMAEASITITNARGRRPAAEIEKMVADAERMRAADEMRAAAVEARSELMALCDDAIELAEPRKDKDLKSAAESVEAWARSAGLMASMVEIQSKRAFLMAKLQQSMKG